MTNEVEIIKSFMKSIPVNLDDLFAQLGITYEKSFNLDTNISGEIERLKSNSFVIRTNANHSDTRQRFTAAHELGHYMLHRVLLGNGADDSKAYRSDLENGNFQNLNIKKKHETEANQFAATVLMPVDLIKEKHSEFQNVYMLASKFDVSEAAMRIRLSSLRLPTNGF